MGKYYCLIAGLPNIALDDSKLTYSISQFRQELDGILTKADKKLIDLFFLKFDNKNPVSYTHLRAHETRGLGDVYKRQIRT